MGGPTIGKEKINELLTRGVHDLVTKKEIEDLLLSGKQLHLKLGTDVTGPQLHLGHTVMHRKLRDFQELGHKVTLIIGDFTTLVGDHSDKVGMRETTTTKEIKQNEETYKEQFFRTVLKDQTTVRHNSEWLKKLDFNDVINLSKQFTIAQYMDRETFKKRFTENSPIGLDEFLYPLMQGYDSIHLECDIEFGGTDQTFNLLAGRKLMAAYNQRPQCALIMKLLTGSDGRPMGKSLKNFIPVMGNPQDMYGAVMSVVDEVVFEYFELLTRVPMLEIDQMKQSVKDGENPMSHKKLLAKEIVKFYHGDRASIKAQEDFESGVQHKQVTGTNTELTDIKGEMKLIEFVRKARGDSASSSDLKRLVEQGGVEVNSKKISDPNEFIKFNTGDIVKVGKRDYLKIK